MAEKILKIVVSEQAYNMLAALRDTGFYGQTIDEVVVRLVDKSLIETKRL